MSRRPSWTSQAGFDRRERLAAKDLERRERLSGGVFLVFGAATPIAKATGAPDWLVIALLTIGLIGAVAGLTLKWTHERAKQREAHERNLWLPPMRVRDAAARGAFYEIGVESEAPHALALLGLEPDAHPEYLSRSADSDLERTMRDAAACGGAHLILVAGPSKAGKSRTLLEVAARTLADAWLIAPRDAAAVAELARGAPPQGLDERPCIVWVDDIEEVVNRGQGLNEQTVKAFDHWNRPVLILGTRGGKGVQLAGPDITRFASITGALSTRYPPVELSPQLDAQELDGVRAAFAADVAARIEREGVGEFMIAASRMVDRLRDTECREGQAILRAAIDWRRAGLLRPITLAELEELYTLYLTGYANPDRFRRGMEWATEPLYANVAPLVAVNAGNSYQPYDYLVEHAARANKPVSRQLLDRAISDYARSAEELTRVGYAAYAAGDHALAERAYGRGDKLGGALAAYNHGALLARRGEMQAAEAAFRRGDERGDASSADALARILRDRDDIVGADAALGRADQRGHPHSPYRLGHLLKERGDMEGAEAAFRRSDERGDADGANSLGVLLDQRDDAAGSEAAFRRADQRGHALGALNLGIALSKRGDVSGAEAAYRRADERGDPEAPNNLGAILRKRGDLDEAEAAFRRAEERGCPQAAENLGRVLNDVGDIKGAEAAYRRADDAERGEGAFGLGTMLAKAGSIDGAEAAFRRADERGHGAAATSLGVLMISRGDRVEAELAFRRAHARGCLDGSANLGLLLQERGEEEAAEPILRHADRLGNEHAASLLGVMLQEREDLVGAEAAFRRAVERGSAHAANNLGVLLSERGDLAGAIRAYRLADERGCAIGSFQLAWHLGRNQCYPEAAAAFRRADERGHAGGAYEVGVSLEAHGKREAAGGAYRRALKRATYEQDAGLADQARSALNRLRQPLEAATDPDEVLHPCCGGWR